MRSHGSRGVNLTAPMLVRQGLGQAPPPSVRRGICDGPTPATCSAYRAASLNSLLQNAPTRPPPLDIAPKPKRLTLSPTASLQAWPFPRFARAPNGTQNPERSNHSEKPASRDGRLFGTRPQQPGLLFCPNRSEDDKHRAFAGTAMPARVRLCHIDNLWGNLSRSHRISMGQSQKCFR